jgi:hypothetical protein
MYLATEALGAAARDYRWLLDRGYPETASLKLVGDRNRLDKDERLVLFRGVFAHAASEERAALVSVDPGGRKLLVDGYNELFTVMHYLAGRPVFIASDGLLRDAGASHGRISDPALFERAQAILAGSFAKLGLQSVVVWFDSPVPFSAAHARGFQEALIAVGIDGRSFIERSADAPLKNAEAGAAVATSDSAVVDALAARRAHGEETIVYDAARAALEGEFGPRDWLDFRDHLYFG